MHDHLFHLDSAAQDSLQNQIRTLLIKAITEGHIPVDSPVPSCRGLARQLSVSRNTVILSYEKLVEDGFLYARERSGYFVSPEFQPSLMRQQTVASEAGASGLDWSRRLVVNPSACQNIIKPSDWRDYPYPFIYGQLDDALFPFNAWRECIRDANSRQAIRNWAIDSFDGDDPLLIEELRTHVLPERGIWAADDEVLISLGTQNSLYIISQLLMAPKITVGIEEPGYVDARNIFETSGARVIPIPLDSEGIVIDERIEACDIVYVTPSHQSPTTVTMTLERRRALLRKAREFDIILIEDDYDSEANFLSAPIPALKSLDRDARVIYVSSLSKTLAPGLRLGYIVAPGTLVEEARALRRLILRHPPSNNQRTVGLFIARGYHDTLTHRLACKYRVRWHKMAQGLQRHLACVQCTPSNGGTSFWVRLPGDVAGKKLVQRAAEYGVLIEVGDIHFKAMAPAQDFVRLAFSSIDSEQIESGLQCLREALLSLDQ
jgi:GntR family transcriptional regulator/MocR family aminotransferase